MPNNAGATNPATYLRWWDRAEELGVDPAKMCLTTYESNSASKFTDVDFIHLKAVWKPHTVDKFSIAHYAREEHVKQWQFLMARPQKPDQDRAIASPQDWLLEFIRASAEQFEYHDARNLRLGAFFSLKAQLQTFKGMNNQGWAAVGDTLKIMNKVVRRSARLMGQKQDAGAPKVSELTGQLGSS